MTLLASTEDFALITGKTLDEGNTARVTRLLELASDAVLASAHGQTILQDTTTDTLRSSGGVFYFPQRPVTAVTSVVINGLTLDPSNYRLEPGGNGRAARLIRRFYGTDSWWGQALGFPWDQFPGRDPYLARNPEAEADVTNTHGWSSVPGQLVGMVVAMANGVMEGKVGGQEVAAESLGSYSVTLTPAQSADFCIGTDAQKVIDRLCKVKPGASVPVAS